LRNYLPTQWVGLKWPTHFSILSTRGLPQKGSPQESEILFFIMSDAQYFTQAGLDKLREEVNELKTSGRKRIAQAIAEAREKGDLRENAEYDAAKHAQGLHEAEIARLEAILANARLIDESTLDTSKALITATVTIKNLSTGKEMKYSLVSPKESDFKSGRISVDSPVGKALLGKSVGDTVEVIVPAGKMQLQVLEINY
jgi:transcription elongation factor GreA